jgi:hypothetical protein
MGSRRLAPQYLVGYQQAAIDDYGTCGHDRNAVDRPLVDPRLQNPASRYLRHTRLLAQLEGPVPPDLFDLHLAWFFPFH